MENSVLRRCREMSLVDGELVRCESMSEQVKEVGADGHIVVHEVCMEFGHRKFLRRELVVKTPLPGNFVTVPC